MAVNAVVDSRRVQGPQTHAIVIGVGDYPHLRNGRGALTPSNDGMGQLTSPPISARAVASWLIETLQDPEKPLASVSLLLSEARSTPFVNPRTRKGTKPVRATADNVEAALGAWYDRGATSIENRLIFFFSGHGISRGSDSALLMEDFGANPRNALDGALDFHQLVQGLDGCAAVEQCFFIDACRASSDTLLTTAYRGRVPFVVDAGVEPPARLRAAPIYYSTLQGAPAYSLQNTVSPFTEALVRAFNGAGADASEGDWRVNTVALKGALDFWMKRAVDGGTRQAQVPPTDQLTRFFLHYLDGPPKASAIVGCRPAEANASASLECLSSGVRVETRGPSEGEWIVDLPVGDYTFVATFAGGDYQPPAAPVQALVSPPYRKVPLPVTE